MAGFGVEDSGRCGRFGVATGQTTRSCLGIRQLAPETSPDRRPDAPADHRTSTSDGCAPTSSRSTSGRPRATLRASRHPSHAALPIPAGASSPSVTACQAAGPSATSQAAALFRLAALIERGRPSPERRPAEIVRARRSPRRRSARLGRHPVPERGGEHRGVRPARSRRWRTPGIPGEVIVADNGSEDGSAELAERGRRPRRRTSRAAATAAPTSRASPPRAARYIVMADADLTYDFDEIPRFVERARRRRRARDGRPDGQHPARARCRGCTATSATRS